MSTKTNNVVDIGHNSNQLTDKLIKTLNLLKESMHLINNASMQFERSCKGKIDRFDKSRMDAFEKVEWWQRGKDTNDHAVNMVDDAMDNIKNYLKANGVELEKSNDE